MQTIRWKFVLSFFYPSNIDLSVRLQVTRVSTELFCSFQTRTTPCIIVTLHLCLPLHIKTWLSQLVSWKSVVHTRACGHEPFLSLESVLWHYFILKLNAILSTMSIFFLEKDGGQTALDAFQLQHLAILSPMASVFQNSTRTLFRLLLYLHHFSCCVQFM